MQTRLCSKRQAISPKGVTQIRPTNIELPMEVDHF